MWSGINPKNIPWEKLPKSFVIKANHDSGSTIIVEDKNFVDKKYIKKSLKYYLKRNYYLKYREYNYQNIPKRIIIESYVEPEDDKGLVDYKFFCFDGVPKFMYIATDRGNEIKGGTKFDFYDLEMNRIKVKQHYPNSTYKFEKDDNFCKMIDLAKELSQGFKHVR